MKLKDLAMELHEVMPFLLGKRRSQLVTVYSPNTGKIEQVGISINDRCEINVDHLQKSGYQTSYYSFEDYGEKILILKDVKVLSFKESLFIDENIIVRMAFLNGGDVHDVMVDILPRGINEFQYCVTYSSGHRDYFPLFQYEEAFVFIERDKNANN